MDNPDYRMYPHVYNMLAQKGQHMPPDFDVLIDPFDNEERSRRAKPSSPTSRFRLYTGSGWYGYTYKTHLNGAQNYWEQYRLRRRN